jgi:hypothetical protein
VSARRQFQGLKSGVPQEHQVGSRFVGIQAQLLQPTPESLKVDLGQFFAHLSSTLSKVHPKFTGTLLVKTRKRVT